VELRVGMPGRGGALRLPRHGAGLLQARHPCPDVVEPRARGRLPREVRRQELATAWTARLDLASVETWCM